MRSTTRSQWDAVEVELAEEVDVGKGRSPSNTRMETADWLSAAMENIWDFSARIL